MATIACVLLTAVINIQAADGFSAQARVAVTSADDKHVRTTSNTTVSARESAGDTSTIGSGTTVESSSKTSRLVPKDDSVASSELMFNHDVGAVQNSLNQDVG